MDERHQTLRYWFFAVGIFSAMLMEYEVHFYSSGALEEGWSEKDLPENFMVASFGSRSVADGGAPGNRRPGVLPAA